MNKFLSIFKRDSVNCNSSYVIHLIIHLTLLHTKCITVAFVPYRSLRYHSLSAYSLAELKVNTDRFIALSKRHGALPCRTKINVRKRLI